jgi:RND family efflux transporter MFP subunit
MKNFLAKIKLYILAHKIMSTIMIIVILGVGYWGYAKITTPATQNRYVLSAVTTGTIVSSITDSGQVSSLNQIAVTPTVSGTLTSVNVKAGDTVRQGETLFNIDDTTAQKAVRDAQIGLQKAQLALATTKSQNTNSDTDQQTTITNAYNTLLNSSFQAVPNSSGNAVATTTNLPAPIISGNYTLGKEGVININFYASNGGISFQASGLTNDNSISSASFATAIGDSGLFLTLPSNYNALANTNWVINIPNTNASDYVSNYNAYQNALQTQNQTSSNSNLEQLNIQSEQIAITQAQNALTDAEQNLSYYHIGAPFDGVMASVPVIVGDNVGSGTTLGTIITTKELADVSLNEVDVAKISLGEKATLTFDAIPNLTIAGQVVEIDSVGTVTQGVVNYNVQISFDTTSNDGVKPGMSVNASIITGIAQNVLMVPSSAIKTTNGVSYVQMFDTQLATPLPGVQGSPSLVPPRNQTIAVGITNGTSTEVTSGLKAGDEIVTKTIASTTTTTATTTAPSILGSTTGRGGGGGAGVRIP